MVTDEALPARWVADPSEASALEMTRQTYLDVGKVIAIIAVIAIHTVGTSYAVLTPGSTGWWFANLAYESSFWAVPLFVMASGALVIPRAMTMTPERFLRVRVGRLIIPLLFWVPLYLVFGAVFQDGPSTPESIARVLATGRPYNHLYFLPLIIGLYLVTPLIAPALRGASRRFVWTAALSALGIGMLDYLFVAIGIGGISLNLVTTWIPFLGYFLVGYAISTSRLSFGRLPSLMLLFVAIVAQDVAAWLATLGDPVFLAYMGGYISVTTVVLTIAAFVALRAWVPQMDPIWTARWAHLSRLTFGVYLGHLLIAVAIMHFAHIDGTSVLLTYVVFAVTVVLSFAAAEIASRVPIGRRLIGL